MPKAKIPNAAMDKYLFIFIVFIVLSPI